MAVLISKMDRPFGAARCGRWIAACADAPVARSDGALLATLPQWPRIKPITCGEYRQATHRCHSRGCKIMFSRRHHNPRRHSGVRLKNSRARCALRSRLRPRHYRASLCSDTAARTWQPVRQAMPVTQAASGCIRRPSVQAVCSNVRYSYRWLMLAWLRAMQWESGFIAIDRANLNLDNAVVVIGWPRSYARNVIGKHQREIACLIPPDHGLQIAEW